MNIEIELLPHQKKILESQSYITAMSCGIGSGKTYTAALLAIIELLRGKRVLLITATYAMLRDVLIAQMKEIITEKGLPYDHNRLTQTIKIGSGEVFCKTDMNCETINGLTRIDTVIIDECRLIREKAFTYAISRQRGVKEAKVYLFGTGCSKSHWFAREAMKPSSAWITADIYSNVKHNGQEYVDRMVKEYEDLPSEFRKRELYGMFTDGDETSLFQGMRTDAEFIDGPVVGGIDIAGTGDDRSAFAIFRGNKLVCLDALNTNNIEILTRRKNEFAMRYGCHSWRHDSTSIGNLCSWSDSVPINFGASGGKRFSKMRTRLYFDLKEKISGGICIGEDAKALFMRQAVPELMATCIETEKETGKLALIPKDAIKRQLRRSPDCADAIALAAYKIINADNSTPEMKNLYMKQQMANPFGGLTH